MFPLLATILSITLLQSQKCSAQVLGLTAPVFTSSSTVTSYSYIEITETFIRSTPCFVTSGPISVCGQRRGIEEKPNYYIHRYWPEEAAHRYQEHSQSDLIYPSKVAMIEVTTAPSTSTNNADEELPPSIDSRPLSSSFIDPDDLTRQPSTAIFNNLVLRLATETIIFATLDGNCAGSSVDFSGFLSCLGLMSNAVVQQTVVITETLWTITVTRSMGYTTILTLAGCTPLGFPLRSCPPSAAFLSNNPPLADIPVQLDSSIITANTNNISSTSISPSAES